MSEDVQLINAGQHLLFTAHVCHAWQQGDSNVL